MVLYGGGVGTKEKNIRTRSIYSQSKDICPKTNCNWGNPSFSWLENNNRDLKIVNNIFAN